MTSPYRAEEAPDEPGRAELLYHSGDVNRALGPTRAALQLGLLGGAAALGVAAIGFVQPAVAVAVASAAAAAWRFRRAPQADDVLFVVDRGELVVRRGARGKVMAQTRLPQLLDVRLDTKEIERVGSGGSPVPAVRFIETAVGPRVEVARIFLVLGDDRAPVYLTEQFLSHMDSVEWAGKIRSFLRKQGWTPADEREAPPSSGLPASADDGDD